MSACPSAGTPPTRGDDRSHPRRPYRVAARASRHPLPAELRPRFSPGTGTSTRTPRLVVAVERELLEGGRGALMGLAGEHDGPTGRVKTQH
jgi:hypothetical protein